MDFATFTQAVNDFLKSAGWALEFTNGDDTYTFNTDSGPKKSFAKAIKDFEDKCLRRDILQTAPTDAEKEFVARNSGYEVHGSLTDANASLPHNCVFYNNTLHEYQTTTE